jgi:glycosyltransferase involved in cell wall biosynthesis
MVVQPYKSATQSGVTQIGYHFNKPMLVTNVGGLSEIIPDKKIGYVVEPESVAIANALVDFFENNRKEIFEQNIVEEKKKFSWENMANTFSSLYNNIKNKS